MPQMAPMSWILLSPMTISITIMILSVIYFSFTLSSVPQISMKALETKSPNFKW